MIDLHIHTNNSYRKLEVNEVIEIAIINGYNFDSIYDVVKSIINCGGIPILAHP